MPQASATVGEELKTVVATLWEITFVSLLAALLTIDGKVSFGDTVTTDVVDCVAEAVVREAIEVEEMTKSSVRRDSAVVDGETFDCRGIWPVGVGIDVPVTVNFFGCSVEDVCKLDADTLP